MTYRNIDSEELLLMKVNWSIGVNPTLTDEERKGLMILSRVREYLMMRRSWGEDPFEREHVNAGKSTSEFDPDKENK